MDSDARQVLKKKYSDAGIKLIVSAFGGTDKPTTLGADATKTADAIANWVKTYDLDGVDVDYEVSCNHQSWYPPTFLNMLNRIRTSTPWTMAARALQWTG